MLIVPVDTNRESLAQGAVKTFQTVISRVVATHDACIRFSLLGLLQANPQPD